MTLKRDASTRLAYACEMPGTRCDPEDDCWPCRYVLLDEPQLSSELARVANADTIVFDCARGWKADRVNFQPCPHTRSQDRSVVKQLDIHGRIWSLTAIFDGHLGHDTVDHTAHHLPIMIEDFLRQSLTPGQSSTSPRVVSEILCKAIASFDEAIASDVLGLFPCRVEELPKLPDRVVSEIVNDGGDNYFKTRLCMYGTTALVALVDPTHDNLWVANLGDCQAALTTVDAAGRTKAELLTTRHNGDNDDEIRRVQREHPGEADCVTDRRVLGVMAPTRCIGDIPFKQPAVFTRKVLYNLAPGFHESSPWESFLERNRTPPYISSQAEVTHRQLSPSRGVNGSIRQTTYLVLCSDGLTDICAGKSDDQMVEYWSRSLNTRRSAMFGDNDFVGTRCNPKSNGVSETATAEIELHTNLAVRLLRSVLGGDDISKVSRVLTLELDLSWIDDTTIIVQTL